MLRKIGLFLCCVAFFALAGGHWAVLQTVAWLNMIANYSRVEGLGNAVAKTFDGKHPCQLCRQIAKSKTSEQKPDAASSSKKMESLAVAIAQPVPLFISNSEWPPCEIFPAISRFESPLVPPPRFLLT